MSEQLRTIDFVPEFLDGLAHLQQYHSQFNPVKGRELSSAILDFAYHTVGSFPSVGKVLAERTRNQIAM